MTGHSVLGHADHGAPPRQLRLRPDGARVRRHPRQRARRASRSCGASPTTPSRVACGSGSCPTSTPTARSPTRAATRIGVDLNRNFSWRWRPGSALGTTFYAGISPLSEPETPLRAARHPARATRHHDLVPPVRDGRRHLQRQHGRSRRASPGASRCRCASSCATPAARRPGRRIASRRPRRSSSSCRRARSARARRARTRERCSLSPRADTMLASKQVLETGAHEDAGTSVRRSSGCASRSASRPATCARPRPARASPPPSSPSSPPSRAAARCG